MTSIKIPDETHINAYINFLATPVFNIVAGKDGRNFTVHSGLLASNSDSLRQLIQTQWKDKSDTTIVWDSWDSETVGRLVQWLYTGEYQVPAPKPVRARQRQLSKSHHDEPPSPPTSVISDPESAPSPTNETAADLLTMDYEEPFLAHAQLYALATFTQINQLRVVCTNQLTNLLDHLKLKDRQSHAADNFVALARYVYRNTDGTREEALRRVISSFAAFNFERLDCSVFMTLLAEGGDFVVDVSRRVMKAMNRKPIMVAPPPPPTPVAPKAAPLRMGPPPNPKPSSSATTSSPLRRSSVSVKPKPLETHRHTHSSPPILEKKPSMARLSSPTLEKKPSMARLSTQASIGHLSTQASIARLSAQTLDRKSSFARLIGNNERRSGGSTVGGPRSSTPVTVTDRRVARVSLAPVLEKKPSVARLGTPALERRPATVARVSLADRVSIASASKHGLDRKVSVARMASFQK